MATLHKDISRPGFTPTPHAANTDIRVHSDRCNLFLFDVYTIISLPPSSSFERLLGSFSHIFSYRSRRYASTPRPARTPETFFFHPLTTTFCLTLPYTFFFHKWRR